jgi:hypothetical protein
VTLGPYIAEDEDDVKQPEENGAKPNDLLYLSRKL